MCLQAVKAAAGQLHPPTVIADVARDGSICSSEEIFGPVLAVTKAKDFEDALDLANDSEYGLTGAVYTKNPDKIAKAREPLPCRQLIYQSQMHRSHGGRASVRRIQHVRHRFQSRRPGLPAPVPAGQVHRGEGCLSRIVAVETIYVSRGVTVHAGPIQWLWVRIHTDDGLVGLGETYPWPDAEAAVVRRSLAPVLLGRDASRIDQLWADMFRAISYSGWAGAEIRAISAVDMALWDLAGKAAGMPVYQLLGGASRDRIRTYNTCYDHISFLTEPVKLARSLLDSGIRAMKIWPFDPIALENRGNFITREQMKQGIEPLRLIKEEFGDDIEVAMEFHGYWNLHCAIQIAQACEEYEPMWLEEMLPQDNLAAYAELAAATSLPLCVSERLMTRWGFRELLATAPPAS